MPPWPISRRMRKSPSRSSAGSGPRGRRRLHLLAIVLGLLHLDHRREVLADVVGQLRVKVDVLLERRALAAPVTRRELLGQVVQEHEAFGAVSGHVRHPPVRRARSRERP